MIAPAVVFVLDASISCTRGVVRASSSPSMWTASAVLVGREIRTPMSGFEDSVIRTGEVDFVRCCVVGLVVAEVNMTAPFDVRSARYANEPAIVRRSGGSA